MTRNATKHCWTSSAGNCSADCKILTGAVTIFMRRGQDALCSTAARYIFSVIRLFAHTLQPLRPAAYNAGKSTTHTAIFTNRCTHNFWKYINNLQKQAV
jgi:hypothetical protein